MINESSSVSSSALQSVKYTSVTYRINDLVLVIGDGVKVFRHCIVALAPLVIGTVVRDITLPPTL